MPDKYYLKYSYDTSPKWYIDLEGKHITLRLSGKPLIFLEGMYNQLGGTDFFRIYTLVKDKQTITNDNDKQLINILKEATIQTNTFLSVLDGISTNGKSPFVMYINPINKYK